MDEDTAPNAPWLRRAARRVRILGLTGATLAGCAAAVAVGSDWIAGRAASADVTETAEAIPVAVRPLERVSGYTTTRRFLGQVEPAQASELSFELEGRVVAITVDEGDSVDEGDVIAKLDTALLQTDKRRLEARRDSLEARLRFAEQSLTRRAALRERGFSPDEALDRARSERDSLQARIAETEAALESVRVRLDKSVLRAPFAGQVGRRDVDTGATVAPGQPVMRLLETETRLVRIGVPTWIDPHAHAEAEIEVAGRLQPATLHAVRPDIDPTTRTRPVLYEIDAVAGVAFGATAALRLDRAVQQDGAWVPVAALREGLGGVWTVLIVDDAGVVRRAAVEIQHAEAERAFVSGAFEEGARLIAAGPHRVTPGQRVRVAGGS